MNTKRILAGLAGLTFGTIALGACELPTDTFGPIQAHLIEIGDAVKVEPAAPAETVPETRTPAWGPKVPLLPNSCLYVRKIDADGVIRERWEDGRQAPCDPDNFDPFGYLEPGAR